MNQIPANQLGSADGMSMHERIKQLYHGYDGASFQFKDGYELAKNEAAQIAKDADELYEALEQAITSMQDSGYQNSHVAVRAGKAALAKARGES